LTGQQDEPDQLPIIGNFLSKVWKMRQGSRMKQDHPAKELYWSYACNRFHLDRSGDYDQYLNFGGGNKALEEMWRLEFINHWLNQLSTEDLNPLRHLTTTWAYEALPTLLAMDNYGDDYSKFWFADALAQLSSQEKDKLMSKQAKNKAFELWTEIMESPVGITPTHRSSISVSMQKALDATSPEEYLHNYSKRKLLHSR
jgi:hypothetical protein